MSGVQLLDTLRNKLLCTLGRLRQQLRLSLRACEIRLRRTVRTDFLLRVPATLVIGVTDWVADERVIVPARANRPSLRMRNRSHLLPPAPVTDELWPVTSIQNDSGLPQGPAQSFHARLRVRETGCTGWGEEIKHIFADDDYVIVHDHAVREPGTRGLAIVNIYRLENGKVVEHWDVIQPIPETAANGNGMF